MVDLPGRPEPAAVATAAPELGEPPAGEHNDESEEDIGDQAADIAGWDWVYDEEHVRQDHEESLARAQLHAGHWEATTRAAAQIRGHISGLLEPLDGNVGTQQASQGKGRLGSKAAQDEGSPEARRSMQVVGAKMRKKEKRFAKVACKQADHLVEAARRKERAQTEMEVAEARCLERQHERMDAQRVRAFRAAGRRSEQQKTLTEFRREKERIWEDYYKKHQKMLQASNLASLSEQSSMQPPGAEESDEEARRTGEVVSGLTKSHGVYAQQLNQWRQAVGENERRTLNEWDRILAGKSKEDILLAEKFRRKTRDVMTMRKDVLSMQRSMMLLNGRSKSSKEKDLEPPASGVDAESLEQDEDGRAASSGAMSSSAPVLGWSSEVTEFEEQRPLLPSQFAGAKRPMMMRVNSTRSCSSAMWRDLSEINQQQLEEKSRHDEQHNAEAQRRRETLLQEQVTKTKSENIDWERRNNVATVRRTETERADEGFFEAKEAALAQKRRLETARRQEQRTRRLQAKDAAIATAQAQKATLEEKRQDTLLVLHEKAEAASQERISLFNHDHDELMEKAKLYGDVSAAAGRRRVAEEVKFRQKAEAEMHSKEERLKRNLHLRNRSGFEREREIQAARSQSSPRPATTGGRVLPSLLASASTPLLPAPSALPPVRRPSQSSQAERPGSSSSEAGGLGTFMEDAGWAIMLQRCGLAP